MDRPTRSVFLWLERAFELTYPAYGRLVAESYTAYIRYYYHSLTTDVLSWHPRNYTEEVYRPSGRLLYGLFATTSEKIEEVACTLRSHPNYAGELY